MLSIPFVVVCLTLAIRNHGWTPHAPESPPGHPDDRAGRSHVSPPARLVFVRGPCAVAGGLRDAFAAGPACVRGRAGVRSQPEPACVRGQTGDTFAAATAVWGRPGLRGSVRHRPATGERAGGAPARRTEPIHPARRARYRSRSGPRWRALRPQPGAVSGVGPVDRHLQVRGPVGAGHHRDTGYRGRDHGPGAGGTFIVRERVPAPGCRASPSGPHDHQHGNAPRKGENAIPAPDRHIDPSTLSPAEVWYTRGRPRTCRSTRSRPTTRSCNSP
ncbi:hypothetical protein HBB16_05995 [Pseudonocardia sp. MCCB 268]|nr:hypothetical protein [Pseudonocardia cytotoxica]